MKLRFVAVASAVVLASTGFISAAQAAPRSHQYQRLAIDQTKLLFSFYSGPPQIVSPPTCREAKQSADEDKVLLLPALSFGSGDDRVKCTTAAHTVLVDLGGFTVTEDARGDTYTLADGQVVTFTRANLQLICNDAIRYVPVARATLDGQSIAGTPVITRNFTVSVNPGANTPSNPYYQDSIDLGHPGTLAACYVGYKALVPVAQGQRNILRVNLTAIAGAPTTLTYVIHVRNRRPV